MFGSLGVPEILLILAVALIVFGPRKLPEIGRTIGKALGEFRKATDELKSTLEREVHMEELKTLSTSVITPVESISRSGPYGSALDVAPESSSVPAVLGSSEEPAAHPTHPEELRVAEQVRATDDATPSLTPDPAKLD
jgi:TatA/E family protein of Tat protein translocase